ncbi:putative MFS family arabinose efflux permease [Ancylobacter sp. 3268]|uniref:MFS transporter n=1 Tax=Ancylobacter sp. 3268 TaxID=2817752 RepID=UPI002855EF35|nr:MFS transporter [Ancylobacter sp. 3268]MDR6951939.1 putative MFS family arabinose efflux permease [Ancylobacter sp. 3268]
MAVASSHVALASLNLFLSDVRDGLGPFLGVFLQQKQWTPGEIGIVMTIGGLAGMVATIPMGALVDSSRAKRAIVVIGSAVVIAASMAILLAPSFGVVAVAQMVNGIAAAALAPAVAGITLGLVGAGGFDRQLGRNEAFNHAGNILAAVLAGVFGWWLGLPAVFALMAAMAVGSVLSVLAIRPGDIDHDAARGLAPTGGGDEQAEGWRSLLSDRRLLVVALTLALFHLGNAAMLPLLGQAMVANGEGDPSALTALTVVVAQATMIPMALLAARLAGTQGYRTVLILALLALPLRGAIAAASAHWDIPFGLYPVQILDGVGAGLLGVATPGIVARILKGTGRFNVGLGVVMTAQGIGASLSTTLGGGVAQYAGYPAAFLVLGGVAVVAACAYLLGGAPGNETPGARPVETLRGKYAA